MRQVIYSYKSARWGGLVLDAPLRERGAGSGEQSSIERRDPRSASGARFPLTRSVGWGWWNCDGDPRQLCIQDVGIHVGPRRPHDSAELAVDPHLREDCGISQSRKDPVELEATLEIQLTRDPVLEPQVQPIAAQRFHIYDVLQHDPDLTPRAGSASAAPARERDANSRRVPSDAIAPTPRPDPARDGATRPITPPSC